MSSVSLDPKISLKGVLIVDDEPQTAKYFTNWFADNFRVYSAKSVNEAIGILVLHASDIGVVIADQRMPGGSGLDLLEMMRGQFPGIVRILATAYAEVPVLTAAINEAAVHRFAPKPWNLDLLESVLSDALSQHEQDAASKADRSSLDSLEDRLAASTWVITAFSDYMAEATRLAVSLHEAQASSTGSANGIDADDILRCFTELGAALRDLNTAARALEPKDIGRSDIRLIINDVLTRVDALCRWKDIEVRVSADDLPPYLDVPVARIEMMLRFLLIEEILSLPQGASVDLRCSLVEEEDGSSSLQLELEDSAALSSQIQPKSSLYPFNLRSSDPRQFGVFLTCAYFLAVAVEGRFFFKVKPEHGVLFAFTLPLH